MQEKKTKSFRNVIRIVLFKREFALTALIIIFSLLLGLKYNTFLTVGNLKATAIGMASDTILAIGMCMMLITGQIDLSVGSTFAVAGAVAGVTLVAGWPVMLAVLAAITVGLVVGFINGFVIEKLKVNYFIATLGMQGIARGVTVILAEGGIAYLPQGFNWIGQKTFLGYQLPVWIMLFLVIVFGVLLAKHRYFRQLYYIGGNEKAATLSGINGTKVKFALYILMGGLAAFSGILSTARFGSAISTAGTGSELRVIAASVIGGCSLSGGEGTVLGVFLGTVFMSLISSALVVTNVSVYWHSIVTGIVLVGAVAFDTFVKNKRRSFSK